ncbi:MAG: hydantoinase B/oxoprolinase family protein [Chloroflexota bacterium]|nr:MAG: hydantoinase B/oxoprolinase family protein [Chloroflexota bacterium]
MHGIDPILVSILQKRLKSITEEMGITLLRTARSPILSEVRDCCTGLYDDRGRMLEQTEYIPILAFALRPGCQYILEYYGDEIYPGDLILHNDVFRNGNQLPDLGVYRPIFYRDELVAWAASKGHQMDIGGAAAGAYNPLAREVWQEGIRIPPVKVYENGKFRRDVWDLIFSNIRYDLVADDIRAQIGACTVGERGILSLIERYGVEIFRSHIEYLFDSTEKMMREEIARIPAGRYLGESYMHDDGVTEGSRHRVRVAVTVQDSEIAFDYAGTDPQTAGYANATYASAAGGTLATLLFCLINPEVPHNEGMLRPVHIDIPEGCFLNARFPAATTFGNHISDVYSEAILKALAQAMPERVSASWNRMLAAMIVGFDPRREAPFVDFDFPCLMGGFGAGYGADGYDHTGIFVCGGGLLSQDYEMLELESPITLLYHEFWPGSGGAGQWRGGLGVKSAFTVDGSECMASILGDGVEEETAAPGLLGGKRGAVNRLEFVYPDGTRHKPRCKETVPSVPTGTIVEREAGGGGGYGDPYLRPADTVLWEVKNGLLSIRQAEEDYGVAIDPSTLAVDSLKTREIRGRRKGE